MARALVAITICLMVIVSTTDHMNIARFVPVPILFSIQSVQYLLMLPLMAIVIFLLHAVLSRYRELNRILNELLSLDRAENSYLSDTLSFIAKEHMRLHRIVRNINACYGLQVKQKQFSISFTRSNCFFFCRFWYKWPVFLNFPLLCYTAFIVWSAEHNPMAYNCFILLLWFGQCHIIRQPFLLCIPAAIYQRKWALLIQNSFSSAEYALICVLFLCRQEIPLRLLINFCKSLTMRTWRANWWYFSIKLIRRYLFYRAVYSRLIGASFIWLKNLLIINWFDWLWIFFSFSDGSNGIQLFDHFNSIRSNGRSGWTFANGKLI